MKISLFASVFLLIFSCATKEREYDVTIISNNQLNEDFSSEIDEAGKALLQGYLYAYGNECTGISLKNKCKILPLLSVEDECDKVYLERLLTWFENDPIMCSKLQNCPPLPANFAIDNTIDKIRIQRQGDTLWIDYHIKGLNNIEEKSWNITQEDKYLVLPNKLIKITQ